MKHNFSFLPSLRRTTLLALLCLGIMPMWAEDAFYYRFQKDGTNDRRYYLQDLGKDGVQFVADENNNNPRDNDASKWIKVMKGSETISPGFGGTYNLYYLKNVATGKYLYCDNSARRGTNGDWYYYTTATDTEAKNQDNYVWYERTDGSWSTFTLYEVLSKTSAVDGTKVNRTYHLHSANSNHSGLDDYCKIPKVPCGVSPDINQFSLIIIEATTYTPVDPCPNCGTVSAE